MFKKGCFDFNILQNERQDGEKYIISMQSIDNGLPVPYGVDRILVFIYKLTLTGTQIFGNKFPVLHYVYSV